MPLRQINKLVLLICTLGVFIPAGLFSQFTTPTLDGVISPGEYGTHVDGGNQQSASGTTWFLTWDAGQLFLAFSGSNYNEPGLFYIDVAPIKPVNGGNGGDGSVQGFYTFESDHAILPFRADFMLYFKNGYTQFRYPDGMGYWGANIDNAVTIATNGGTNTVEVAIPWNLITNGGGIPASFNWMAYRAYDYGPGNHGIYGQVPTGNPGCTPCAGNPSKTYFTNYFNILSTANGSATPPFSTRSFTYMEDKSASGSGGYWMTGGDWYDITINDTISTDNTDNDSPNQGYNNVEISNRLLIYDTIRVAHDLYVGLGSALLPGDNISGDNLAVVEMTGPSGTLSNRGRIDCNPEVSGAGDWDRRKIKWIFSGTTTVDSTNLFKDKFRLSDVWVQAGATLQAPAAGTADIELQWGILEVDGILDFGDGSAGVVDLGLRGDWTLDNDYYLDNPSGTGTFIVHHILIGRNTSRLRPVSSGGLVSLQVKGDFQNYHQFIGKEGSGQIDVVMNGITRQYLRGNTTETLNGETEFFNFEIANNNGAGTNNNGSDVVFESFGGGTIDYFVNGELTLTSGDLITRDGTGVHNFTLRDSATVNLTGASNDNGTLPSCFVDGPLRYEIENSGMVTRHFPVGKTYTRFGNYLGDYRLATLEIDHTSATKTTYVAEMFPVNRSTFYSWPAVVMGETIGNISTQRYWNISQVGAGAAVDSAFITLHYHTDDRTDDVTDPPALRIVKDDGAGNWVNIAPLISGGTAVGVGSVRSKAFSTFSDFTLANIVTGTNGLPVEWGIFHAGLHPEGVQLDWQTLSEENVDVFEVFRSMDGENFSFLQSIPARNQASNYQTLDRNLPKSTGEIFYRLRQVDLNGSSSWSEIERVDLEPESGLSSQIFPNPSAGKIYLEWYSHTAQENIQLELFDLMGKKIWSLELESPGGIKEFILPSRISNGQYFIQITSGLHRNQHRLILQR